MMKIYAVRFTVMSMSICCFVCLFVMSICPFKAPNPENESILKESNGEICIFFKFFFHHVNILCWSFYLFIVFLHGGRTKEAKFQIMLSVCECISIVQI